MSVPRKEIFDVRCCWVFGSSQCDEPSSSLSRLAEAIKAVEPMIRAIGKSAKAVCHI